MKNAGRFVISVCLMLFLMFSCKEEAAVRLIEGPGDTVLLPLRSE
jgi:hypothetical protein